MVQSPRKSCRILEHASRRAAVDFTLGLGGAGDGFVGLVAPLANPRAAQRFVGQRLQAAS
jgi:hypothetical protein